MKYYSSPFIESLWARNNDEAILDVGRKQKTAGELKTESIHLATSLRQEGMKLSDRVILAVVPGWDFLVAVYALLLVGAELVLIDPEMGKENYREKLKQLNAPWAIIDRRILFLYEHPLLRWYLSRKGLELPQLRKFDGVVLSIGPKMPLFRNVQHLSKGQQHSVDVEFKESYPEKPTFIVYTSGTVKTPKGVSHSLHSIGTSIQLLGDLLKNQGATHLATHMPHYQLLGVNAGIKVSSWNQNWRPGQKLRFIAQNNISTLFGPPSDFLPLMEYLRSRKRSWPSCLKLVYFGSAPVHVSFLKRWFEDKSAPECTCLYGMTENLMAASIDGRNKLISTAEGDLLGIPFPGVEFRVNSDSELEIKSEQMFKGYLDQKPQVGWHSTGDYGKIDEHGRVILIGRKKDMIIRGNFNIYPSLYESTIERIEGVREAVLIGVYKESIADEVVGLFVDGDEKLTENQLMNQLKSGENSIDKAALPDKIFFKKLPRSGRSGKVNKQELQEWMRTRV